MDETMTIILVGVLAVVGVGGVLFFLLGDANGGAKKRLGVANQRQARSSRKSREETLQADTAKRLNELHQANGKVSLRARLSQAGLTMSPAQFLLMFQLIGVGAGVGGYLASGILWVGLGVAPVVAFLGPRWYLKRKTEKRILRFAQHFPNAIDILIRGVKSGLPVSEGLRVISKEVPEPVGAEFRLLVDAGQVGVSLEDALERMSERVPTQDVNFFRTVLSIQKQTGGNLAEALGNLSETLRERYKLKLKIKALTAEARTSAIILGCLPLIVGGAVYLLRPDYVMLLFSHPTGQMMSMGAAVWMTLGVLTLRAMVNFKM